jgi:hypothetical protein
MTGHTGSTRGNDFVKVAHANDEAQAELLQDLLRPADVGSVVRRASGFDVPEFLAAGPREVLARRLTSLSRETFCARSTRVSAGHRRGPALTGRRGFSPGC